ncbi:lovastatin nonaketide synthase [Aspergillus terreus]|uniref:Lovastatin nonaketide synthase n=1 Tax=Aspergillus terreus TaxID=33178 RepID=A0A5M3YW42_ASPTE|nr:hypothetical protein ATETN484_0004056000 [Aspergillus terreus]GFF13449.1 lovastatin nonaketide synthase [Aspergillus terreus]
MRTLFEVVDQLAAKRPHGLWVKAAASVNGHLSWNDITWSQLATAVNYGAYWMEARLGPPAENEPVAYMGVGDIRCPIMILAAMKTGYKILLTSPRKSQDAQNALLSAGAGHAQFRTPSRSDPTYQDARIVLGLDPSRLAGSWEAARENTDLDWVEDGRFSELKALVEAMSGKTGHERDRVDNAVGVVAECLMQRCAGILMMSVDDFALEGSSVGGYGLDSMIGAELRSWLFKTFGLNIPFQELLSSSLTFKGLSLLVLKALGVDVE